MADGDTNIDRTLYFMSREDEELQTQALAKRYNLPYIDLVNYPILGDVLFLIPEEEARRYGFVAYLRSTKELRIAITNPAEETTIHEYLLALKEKTGLIPFLSVCSRSSLNYALSQYQTFIKQKETAEKLEISEEEQNKYQEQIKNLEDLKNRISEVSTSDILNVIFAGAAATNASDVHLEPETEDTMLVRYRIDGVLTEAARLPIMALKTLSSRIKYLSKLKIDVTKQPQDGRFDSIIGGNPVDIRVSIIPAAYGESIVMRLLPREKKFITLEELGFNQKQLEIINKAIAKPHGIIFNTGPTGSGKTTTLYAILTNLNKPGVKIITLEDPIEYRMKGVDQTQVNDEKGYTFANGLKSILRQDPDIIMVG